ncbi:MAG: TraM recognition domain-containing protein [Bacillota bacterium]
MKTNNNAYMRHSTDSMILKLRIAVMLAATVLSPIALILGGVLTITTMKYLAPKYGYKKVKAISVGAMIIILALIVTTVGSGGIEAIIVGQVQHIANNMASILGTQQMKLLDWLFNPLPIILSTIAIAGALIILEPASLEDRIIPKTVHKDIESSSKGFHGREYAVIGFSKNRQVTIPTKEGINCIAIGSTGCGKTSAVLNIAEAYAQNDDITIIVDGKGDKGDFTFYDIMPKLCQKYGKKLYVVDMLNPYHTDRINTFKNCNETQIIDQIIGLSDWSEPHYKAQAADFWQVMVQLMELVDEPIDIHNVVRCSNKSTCLDLLAFAKKNGLIKDDEYSDWKRDIETNSKSAEDAIPRLGRFIRGTGGKMFSSEGLDLMDVYNENACILVLVDGQSYAEFAEIMGALIIKDCKKMISKINSMPQSERRKVLIICDEIQTYLSDDILSVFNKGRSAGIQAIAMCQSLSDLHYDNNDKLAHQIIGNSNVFLAYRQNDPGDAEELAKIMGTRDTIETTSQTQGQDLSGMGTVKVVKSFKVPPDKIKELPQNVGYYYNKHSRINEKNANEPVRFSNRFVRV